MPALEWYRRPRLLLAAIATGLGALATLRAAMGHLIMPTRVPINAPMVSEPLNWGLWIVFSPAIAWIIQRYTPNHTRVARIVTAHVILALVLASIHGIVYGRAAFVLGARMDSRLDSMNLRGRAPRWNPIVAIPSGALVALTEYATLVGLCYVVILATSAADRQRETAELHQRLTTARLRALQAQLHPHFLFNVLHSTAMLAPTDGLAAREVLTQLAALLRRMLTATERLYAPLSEEMDFLDRYLSLEQRRFSDRLTVDFAVDDRALRAIVPSLILQPLVENAVRHGMSRSLTPGRIAVTARAVRGRLEVSVVDDGPGLPPGWNEASSSGVGITNVRQRLDHLFEGRYEFRVESAPAGGTIVTLDLPYLTTIPTTDAAPAATGRAASASPRGTFA